MSDFTTNAKPPLVPCHHGNQPVCVECLKDDLARARGEVVFFAERLEKQDNQYSHHHPAAAIWRAKREGLEAVASAAKLLADAAEWISFHPKDNNGWADMERRVDSVRKALKAIGDA